MRRAKTTPSRCTGVLAAARTQGKRTQHGKPQSVVRDDQPDAREGQAGRSGVTERLVVPLKPGNAGGGKGPQFKTDARRSEGPGDWATYQLRTAFRNCRRRCTRKRRQNPAIASMPSTTRSAAKTFWRMPMLSAAPTRAHRAWTVRMRGVSLRNAAPLVPRLGRACLPTAIVGFFYGAVQPHPDQMQHAPINDPARYRLQKARHAAERFPSPGALFASAAWIAWKNPTSSRIARA